MTEYLLPQFLHFRSFDFPSAFVLYPREVLLLLPHEGQRDGFRSVMDISPLNEKPTRLNKPSAAGHSGEVLLDGGIQDGVSPREHSQSLMFEPGDLSAPKENIAIDVVGDPLDIIPYQTAIEWLDNAGSSSSATALDDVLDAYEIVEVLLKELYGTQRRSAARIAKQINRKRGPRRQSS